MQIVNIYPLLNTERIYTQKMSMALAHLALKYPAYTECFRKYQGYKILDNSIVELGDSVSLEDLLNVAHAIDADEIILPDVFDNGEETVKLVKHSIRCLKENDLLNTYKLMAVCQGKNIKEIEKCFEELNKIPEIDVIGIPKRFATKHELGRPGFEFLWTNSQSCSKDIHLLGLANCFNELLEYKFPERIRSCDTCLMSMLALEGKHFYARRKFSETINLEKSFVTLEEFENVDESR